MYQELSSNPGSFIFLHEQHHEEAVQPVIERYLARCRALRQEEFVKVPPDCAGSENTSSTSHAEPRRRLFNVVCGTWSAQKTVHERAIRY